MPLSWFGVLENKGSDFLYDTFGFEDVKFLCKVFYRNCSDVWDSLKTLKQCVVTGIAPEAAPTKLKAVCQTLFSFRHVSGVSDAFQLYTDILSVGIHAMWLERFNSKAGILCGDKHKYWLGVEKMNHLININESRV